MSKKGKKARVICPPSPESCLSKWENEDLLAKFKLLLTDVVIFSAEASVLKLRSYQEQVARAIVRSVEEYLGLTIVVAFPRQSGKNELQAQVETFLLTTLCRSDAEMVKISPTYKPQTLNAMRRLERVLGRNIFTKDRWEKETGYIYRIGRARIFFLSGSPTANVVGATASTLLECDEAQDVQIAKWDKDFSPMAASTNATRVFWGTMWTSKTLLAREMRAAQKAQEEDGERRVFVLTAEDVAREVPAYGAFVAVQVAKLGRNHPLVKTQFFSEEIDAEGGLFPPARRALMQGEHERQRRPAPGATYAILLDVAGEDESGGGEVSELENAGRDSTVLTVVEVDLSSLADELLKAPTYRVVDRCSWVGVKHTSLYGQIKALAEHWKAKYAVVDATGVGAGLGSFLDKALPGRVVPFIFNQKTKSELGFGFLAAIDTGRYKEYRPQTTDGGPPDKESEEFWRQISFVQYEASEDRHFKWCVPNGTRDPGTGELVHDDFVLSAALCAELDKLEWAISAAPLIMKAADPLAEMDREGF